MRNFLFPNPLMIVLCCCDSINYLTSAEDLIRVLNQAYKRLQTRGLLLFDLNSDYIVEFTGEQSYAELL